VSDGAGRRGRGLWAALAGLGLLLTAAVDAAGLRAAQGLMWPEDLLNYGIAVRSGPPPDLVIFGSSRASFGLPPAALRACLSEARGTPVGVYNLAQPYATGLSFEALYRELRTRPEARPRALLLALDPEALDDSNPHLPEALGAHTGVADLPRELVELRSPREALGALRVFTRGAEALAILAFGRHRADRRLSWRMRAHGGGQWCGPACGGADADLEASLPRRSPDEERRHLAAVGPERFDPYIAGEGRVHTRLLRLLDDASDDGVPVFLVLMPLHERFLAQIPATAQRRYEEVVERLRLARGLPVFDARTPALQARAAAFVDADHLGPEAAFALADELCAWLGPQLPAGG